MNIKLNKSNRPRPWWAAIRSFQEPIKLPKAAIKGKTQRPNQERGYQTHSKQSFKEPDKPP